MGTLTKAPTTYFTYAVLGILAQQLMCAMSSISTLQLTQLGLVDLFGKRTHDVVLQP